MTKSAISEEFVVRNRNNDLSAAYYTTKDGFPDLLQSGLESKIRGLKVWKNIRINRYDSIAQISWKHYGNSKYWKWLLIYNDLIDPLDLPTKLKLFSLTDFLMLSASGEKYRIITTDDGLYKKPEN